MCASTGNFDLMKIESSERVTIDLQHNETRKDFDDGSLSEHSNDLKVMSMVKSEAEINEDTIHTKDNN